MSEKKKLIYKKIQNLIFNEPIISLNNGKFKNEIK